MLTNGYQCSPEPKELAVGEGEMVVNGLLSAKRRQHSIIIRQTQPNYTAAPLTVFLVLP